VYLHQLNLLCYFGTIHPVIQQNSKVSDAHWCLRLSEGHCSVAQLGKPLKIVLILLEHFWGAKIWWMQTEAGWLRSCQPSNQTKPNQTWPVSLPVGGYHPHPPSPFISSTQPEGWYSFYHPTEGGMLSRPRHCSKGVHPVTKSVLTTSRGKIRTCVLSHCSPARNLQTAAPAEASGCEQLA